MPDRGKPTLLLSAAILVVTLALGATSAAAVDSPVGLGGYAWKPVFDDEFNGSSLDTSKWYPSRWFAVHCAPGATPGEMQYYTDRPANVSVSGGNLHLTGRKESYNCPDGSWAGTRPYTSGWVQTGGGQAFDGSQRKPGFTMGLGYTEARVKLPPGKALWSAFWMMSVSTDSQGIQRYTARPEIDGLEVLGDSGDIWRVNLHLTDPDVDWGEHYQGPDTTAGWHTIGVWRKADSIEWYADGQRVWAYDGPGIPSPSVRMYLILNLVIGGEYPGTPDASTPLPADMLVDYVRAWEPAALPPVSQDQPPQVSLTAPAAGSHLGSTLSAAANAWDDHGLNSVEFWLDSSRVASDYVAPYAAAVATSPSLAPGSHTLSARTVDGQGLSASSAVTVYRGGSAGRHVRRTGHPAYRAETSGSKLFLRGPARRTVRVTFTACSGPPLARPLHLDVRMSRKGRAKRALPGSRFCVIGLRDLKQH